MKYTGVAIRMLAVMLGLMLGMDASAQLPNKKFGKPTKEEWGMTSVSFAPEADAVVLYKSVDVTYSLAGAFSALGSGGEGSLDDNRFAKTGTNKFISPEGASMMYDVKVRVKILKDSGAGFAAMDIISLNEKEDMNMRDDFYEMKVMVFSNRDGKVKKQKLPDGNFTDERIDDHYMIRHVRVPDVKAGDIVEYQYKLFSNRITFIFDTQLQESIPVVYSLCRLDIPYFLQFNVNKPEIPNVSASVALGNVLIKSPNNDMQNPRKCVTNVYTIEAHNLAAYDGAINLQNLGDGTVYNVRTQLKDKRYDVKEELAGPVRHLIIGR